jgi:hypothetical protein
MSLFVLLKTYTVKIFVYSSRFFLYTQYLPYFLKHIQLTGLQGEKAAGINVRKGAITNILEENVVQPLLVSTSAITLATETVRSILKIDDIVNTTRG